MRSTPTPPPSAPRPILVQTQDSFGGDISWHTCVIYIYEWELGSSGEKVFSDALKLHDGALTSLLNSYSGNVEQNAADAKAATSDSDQWRKWRRHIDIIRLNYSKK